MAIMVQYRNNTFGYVENSALDDLIGSQEIIAFRRESGWARIGSDPIRINRIPQSFDGPDRRVSTVKRSCLTCADFVNSLCQSLDCSSRISWQGKQVEMNGL